MKTVTYIFMFLVFVLWVNIICFIYFDEYRFLLRKIKYPEMSIYINNSKITDEYWIINPPERDIFIEEEKNTLEDTKIDIKEPEDSQKEDNTQDSINIEDESQEKRPIALDAFYDYDFEKSSDSSLFWLFYDYIWDFSKYSSKELNLYFFKWSQYNQIKTYLQDKTKDIVDYSINEVNNFWDYSFYLNWDNDVVMLIIEYPTIVLWAEIQYSEYKKIKEILLSL